MIAVRGRPPKKESIIDEAMPKYLHPDASPEEIWIDGYMLGQKETIEEIERIMRDDKDIIINRMNGE